MIDLKSSQERAEWLQSVANTGLQNQRPWPARFNPRVRLKPLAATLLALGAIKQ